MANTPQQTIANQTFTTTQVVSGGLVAPSVGLYQPVYPLTETEFMRLRQSSPVLTSVAGAVISFGLVYFLPLVVARFLRSAPFRSEDIWVSGISLGAGILILLLSFFVSSDRRTIVAKIKKHFADNPGQHEIRIGSP